MGGYYHFPDYLLDLDGLYAHLGIERAALLGHSMGASIACYFGGAFPERVWGMCLLDGIGPPDASERPSPPQRIARWIGEVRRREARTPTPLESLEKAAEAIKQVSTRATPETLLALAEQATRLSSDGDRFWRFDPLHRTQGAMAFQAEVFYRFLETIDCPVYALWAEHSPMHTPDEGRRLDALGESLAKVDTIPDTGHNLHHERPDEVAKRVRAFLETCPSP